MCIGVKHFVALSATNPPIRNTELIRHDLEHRGAGGASGNQAHLLRIVGPDRAAIQTEAVIRIQPSSLSATVNWQ